MAADRLATAAARLPALIASVQATAQRAGNGTSDLEQGLVPLLRDMQATAQNLREMTESLRRYPAQVFGQPPPRGAEAHDEAPLGVGGRGGAGRLLAAAEQRRMCSGATGRSMCGETPVAPPNPRGRVLLVRDVRAGPGLEVRGLQWLQRDGSVHVDFYEQWAVPPAQAVEDDLRQWLADAGLFRAVVAPGSRLNADFVAGGRTRRVHRRSERRRGPGGAGAGPAGSAARARPRCCCRGPKPPRSSLRAATRRRSPRR